VRRAQAFQDVGHLLLVVGHVDVRDPHQVVEDPPVGADDQLRARRVDLPDAGAEGFEERDGQLLGEVREVAEDLVGVGRLRRERG
jgi:hypothetical protein